MFIFQTVQEVPTRRRTPETPVPNHVSTQPALHPSPSNQPNPVPAGAQRPAQVQPPPQTLQPAPTLRGQTPPRAQPDTTDLMLRVARESPAAEAAMEALLSPRDPSRRGFDRAGLNNILSQLQSLDSGLYERVTNYLRTVPRERDADARYLALAAYSVIATTPLQSGATTDRDTINSRTEALEHIKTRLLQFANGVESSNLSAVVPRRASPVDRA